jgi:PAS domain S-box-containing protein
MTLYSDRATPPVGREALGAGSTRPDPADLPPTSAGRVERLEQAALLCCDAELHLTDVNPALCRFLGQRREELLGHSLLEFVHDEDVAETIGTICRRLSVRQLDAVTVDVRFRCRRGLIQAKLWLSSLPDQPAGIGDGATPPPRSAPSFLGRVDSANASRVEDGANEEDFAVRAPDLIWRYRLWPEPGFDFVSPSSVDLLGYPPSAFYDIPDLLHQLTVDDEERQKLTDLLDGRRDTTNPVVLRLTHRNGQVRMLEQRVTSVLDGERRTLAIEAISRDVTERSRTQAELTTEVTLRRLLHETATRTLETTNPDEVFLPTLGAVCRHTGWPVGHALVLDPDLQTLSGADQWHLEDPERFESFRQLVTSRRWPADDDPAGLAVVCGEPVVVQLEGEGQPRSARMVSAAEHRLHQIVAIPVPVDDGVAAVLEFGVESRVPPSAALLAALADAARNVGQSLRRTHEVVSLRRLDVARTEFVSRAAHELRGPVGSIAVMAGALALEARRSGSEDMAGSLERLASQAERLQQMASRLLALSQVDEGRLEVKLERVPLALAASAAVSAMLPVSQPSLAVVVDIDDDLTALADPLLVDEILANLLANARRYGGPHIQVSATSEGDQILLSVVDDGSGIADELADQLFQPLRRTLAGPQQSGLGLALVRQLAKAMGGDVSYASAEPHGACFTVVLAGA